MNNINKEVYEKIVDTLVQDFKKEIESIKSDTSLSDDLDLDSLDKVDLIIALESFYDVEIAESENEEIKKQFYRCNTVQELSDFLAKLIQKEKENK